LARKDRPLAINPQFLTILRVIVITIIRDYVIGLFQLGATMAPYLLLGFLLAGFAHAWFPKNWIRKHLGGNGWFESIKASLFGIPLPVCSCGVIPLAKELKKRGAGNAGVTAFLISTPQTGVDSITATAGLMGWPFAVIRVLVAFASGVMAGGIVSLFERGSSRVLPAVTSENEHTAQSRSLGSILYYGLVELPGELRQSLLLGLAIAAMIATWLPGLSSLTADSPQWVAYLGVLLLSVPLYVCSTGSIPIAFALITAGFSPGTALIFLVAGPSTSMITLTTMTRIVGWRNTVVYLATLAILGVSAAALLDQTNLSTNMQEALCHSHEQSNHWFEWFCLTILLLALLFEPLRSLMKNPGNRMVPSASSNTTWVMQVEGMGCKKCVAKVTHLLETIPGIQQVSVDLDSSTVTFSASAPNREGISTLLASEDYQVKSFNKTSE
jgi:uncharacterized protein